MSVGELIHNPVDLPPAESGCHCPTGATDAIKPARPLARSCGAGSLSNRSPKTATHRPGRLESPCCNTAAIRRGPLAGADAKSIVMLEGEGACRALEQYSFMIAKL